MMTHLISERYKTLPSSEFAKILEIASESKDVISLGPGEPDFVTPKPILDHIKKNLDRNTHYSSPEGKRELREAIVKNLKKENKITADPDQIIVTGGSTESLYLASLVTIDPGEEVVVPDPGFLDYTPMVESITGNAVPLALTEENGFEFDADEAKKIVGNKTKAIIINTPSNPTGRIFKRKTLEEVADFAVDNKLKVFSDEAYEKFVYGKSKHISIGSLNGMGDYVITFKTFSKSYAMTGFRVGYAVGNKDVISAMTRMHLYTSISAPTISQEAALFALSKGGASIKKMVAEYDRRRMMMMRRLDEIDGVTYLEPEGAFYIFPNIKSFNMSSVKFSHALLKKAKVLVVPGNEFGKNGEGHVRLSYATSYEKIEQAMDRIEKAVSSF